MDAVTSRPLPGRPLAVPNLLTYARIVAVPLVVACMYGQAILAGGMWLRWVALVIFIAAAWYVIGLLPGEFQRWAKAILLVIVAIFLIYWLAGSFPSPFGR